MAKKAKKMPPYFDKGMGPAKPLGKSSKSMPMKKSKSGKAC